MNVQLAGHQVAVFGSSHSAMIVLPNLLANPVAKVINFYRSPLEYAVYLKGWTLFDDVGLKGQAACWARENIDGTLPERLERCWVGSPEFEETLATCDHVVYTVGFERRKFPLTSQWGPLEYNAFNGILAPGLFGVGIAYPQYKTDPLGFGQYRYSQLPSLFQLCAGFFPGDHVAGLLAHAPADFSAVRLDQFRGLFAG